MHVEVTSVVGSAVSGIFVVRSAVVEISILGTADLLILLLVTFTLL